MAMADPFLMLDLPDESATAALAEDVAVCLAQGDVVALCGGLGVGKTTFARALIRALADDPVLEVPSPTFTLMQVYPGSRLPVAHVDLYRLSDPSELDEIGFTEALVEGAALVEWPERADGRLPGNRLVVTLEIAGGGRRASLSGDRGWRRRMGRSRAARNLISRAGWSGASRRHLQGDASTRRFERIRADDRSAVLLDWPKAGATNGDPRAQYRARDVRAFIAVDEALRRAGLSAPEIYASDLSTGLVLMENLGSEPVANAAGPIAERYEVAVDVLAAIHAAPRPAALPGPDDTVHRLPTLAAEALNTELDLFADWYVAHATGEPLSADGRLSFAALWAPLFDRLAQVERSWVLFDVQSPNLVWLGDRQGLKRLGLLDFQDMFVGPAAYDVASLCQDARVTVPLHLEAELRERYVARRLAADPRFDIDAFGAAYAVLGSARALKNLGVFARQADHLNQKRYLQHIPRLGEYLVRNFAHPVLSGLAVWYERHLDRV